MISPTARRLRPGVPRGRRLIATPDLAGGRVEFGFFRQRPPSRAGGSLCTSTFVSRRNLPQAVTPVEPIRACLCFRVNSGAAASASDSEIPPWHQMRRQRSAESHGAASVPLISGAVTAGAECRMCPAARTLEQRSRGPPTLWRRRARRTPQEAPGQECHAERYGTLLTADPACGGQMSTEVGG